ncbi:histidinol-phosphatase-like protein [Calycina marina]|uniref:Histidinol-phosphatase n=1 Tax=Calycina marina TaxID=1763456 RepID=A0A9P7Z5M8_9HELO|nr:histidinol-phosphatase-like protein [Calycina marina]
MAFSMHSHSGQFCPGHAKDQLEVIIQTAIARGFQSFALTEHMPRTSPADLYPEEVSLSLQESIDSLIPMHEAFLVEAVRLRAKYQDQIKILIGFEGEWIRPSYGPFILSLASHPDVDYFIGSVHHVHEIPIDYDKAFYDKAKNASGGTDELLFSDYFDSQLQMLQALKPRVVGHFDLIRLLAEEPNQDLRMWPKIWEKIERNLKVIVEQGGLLEINSSALRKGLKEPYPARAITEKFLKMGGKMTLSDDSHGIDQVGTNFGRAVDFLENLGAHEVFLLESRGELKNLKAVGVKLVDIKSSLK